MGNKKKKKFGPNEKKDKSRKETTEERNGQETTPEIPVYMTEAYKNQRYTLTNLTGTEMNLLRFALTQYFRAHSEPQLWSNLKVLSNLQEKIDNAKPIKVRKS